MLMQNTGLANRLHNSDAPYKVIVQNIATDILNHYMIGVSASVCSSLLLISWFSLFTAMASSSLLSSGLSMSGVIRQL